MPTKGQAPQPPSAAQLAQAQTGTNVSTALANASINAVNQKTPDGALTYSTDGFDEVTDPSTGQVIKIPKRTLTQTLSPQQQQLHDTNATTSQNLAQVGATQSARLGELMSKPFSLDNAAVEGRINELASARLMPELQRRRDALTNQLAQQGVNIGSTAWAAGQDAANRGENDAINQLLLNGRSQATNELLTARNQPINEILALAGGSGVSQPSFASTPQTNIPTTDVAGLQQQQYANQVGAYNTQQQGYQDTLGGLFGLGSSLIKLSDRRAKTDVSEVGKTEGGHRVYTYRYKGQGGPKQLGLMAQDVEKRQPGAVINTGGLKLVDYGKALARKAA